MGLRMKKNKTAAVFGAFVSVFFISNTGYAFDWQELGQKIAKAFNPSIKYSFEYTDNVFLEPSGESDDIIQTVTPSLVFSTPLDGDRHQFDVEYYADIAFFHDFDDEDFDNHYVNGRLFLDMEDYQINVADRFAATSSRAATEFTDRVERYENNFTPNALFEWNKVQFNTVYDYFVIDYRDNSFAVLDHDLHTFTEELSIDLAPKTRGILEYSHGIIEYDRDRSRDGDLDEALAGIEGEIFNKWVGTLKGGYQTRYYDNSDQDFSGGIVEANLVGSIIEGTNLSLSFLRRPAESTFNNINFYTANIFNAQLNQTLFYQKLLGVVGFSYQDNEYEGTATVGAVTRERADSIYIIQAGVDYTVKDWINSGIHYFYKERDSNFGVFDYEENSLIWSVTAQF